MTGFAADGRINPAQVRLVHGRIRERQLDPAAVLPAVLLHHGVERPEQLTNAQLDVVLAAIAAYQPPVEQPAAPRGVKPDDPGFKAKWHTPATIWQRVKPGYGGPDDARAVAASYVFQVRNGAEAGCWNALEFMAAALRDSNVPEPVKAELRQLMHGGLREPEHPLDIALAKRGAAA